MEDSIIEIKNDDFINNLDKIIENSNIFKENTNLEAINCYIFYLEDNTLSSLAFKQELLYSITKNGDEAKYL